MQQQQLFFVNEVSDVKYELSDSSSSGNLGGSSYSCCFCKVLISDLVIGKDILLAEEILFSSHKFLCPSGSVSHGNSCVNCPVGTFFNIVSKECSPCTAGSYQPEEAQVMQCLLVCSVICEIAGHLPRLSRHNIYSCRRRCNGSRPMQR